MTTNHREEVEETPDGYGAFPRLSAEQIERLNELPPATGERHEEANMSTVER